MTGETERMNSYKRQLLCIGLGIVIALLRALLSAFPTVIDTYYSKGINKWWIEQLSRLSALFFVPSKSLLSLDLSYIPSKTSNYQGISATYSRQI